MPFRSEKQRRWMWANEPEVAQRWADEEKGKRTRKQKRKRRHQMPKANADGYY